MVTAHDDLEHRALVAEADRYRAEVARWQDECAGARDAMAKAKRVMDFATALLTFKAREGGEQHGNRHRA
jgi:hypothetical protein